MNAYPKRLIEVDLPIKQISAHARREKSIRHGHISTLHIWWARRPLAACRAVICASLWPDPADELCPAMFRNVAREQMTKWAKDHLNLVSEDSWGQFVAISKDVSKLNDLVELRAALLNFIADFANWDNSNVPEYLETSRILTQMAHEALGGESGSRPLIVDSFTGGGAIPLEALRVGADTFASDLNPVAVLLNKVMLEYVPKYGQKLTDEVIKWGQLIKEEAEKKLNVFYPKDSEGGIPAAYIWARNIRCEGPGCGVEIPLLKSLWLSKTKSMSIALMLVPNKDKRCIDLSIIERKNNKWIDGNGRVIIEKPNLTGTIRRSSVTCPCCGYTTPANSLKRQFSQYKGGARNARMIAVVTITPGQKGRRHRLPTDADLIAYRKAEEVLKSQEIAENSELSLIPDEVLPLMSGVFNAPIYGHNTWGSLFNARQALALSTFATLIRELDIINEMDTDSFSLAIAIKTCLSLVLNKIAEKLTSLSRYDTGSKMSGIIGIYSSQRIPMIWDFGEGNPLLNRSGGWIQSLKWFTSVLERITLTNSSSVGNIQVASATAHPLPNDIVSAFITDPPYYNAVPYADLSDFFYVWLKRTIRDLHPDLLTSMLTIKDNEICEMSGWDPVRYPHKNGKWYETQMELAMSEGRRVLAPQGIGIIVFAHKTTSGWEALLKAMINAGWVITGSWPIDTEMGTRLRARNSAVLASSVHLVCRPRENIDGSLRIDDIGDWRDVLKELPRRIHEWMPRLAEEGVVGADAIFACLGPALEIFSRYSSVEKASGEKVELKEYLEEVWAAVSREALNMIFEGADASGFEEDARLTAMWLWTLRTDLNGNNRMTDDGVSTKSLSGYNLEYDAARKIAQGLGAHLDNLSNLVEIKGSTAMLLSTDARTRYLFGKDASDSPQRKLKKKSKQIKLDFAGEFKQIEEELGGWSGELIGKPGLTVLDQLHQSMILFGAGRSEALKRFLVEEGVGRNPLFWRLAQAFSALYPAATSDKRWVDGVLARKKGLGL
jgi:putative DNA methylase